jgi:hypothetical protein
MLRRLLTISAVVSSDAALLLRTTRVGTSDEPDEPATPEEIHEKWDKMDDFLEIMFVMACKWKHGKDVNGLAAEKLKNGDIEADELSSFKGKTQDENVESVLQACGMIVSKGEKKCRSSCARRLGTMDSAVMKERAKCDKLCVSRYDEFEKSCHSKADNLKTLYGAKQKMAAAKKACYEDHCHKYPTVWMKAVDDQKDEVDTQCEKACTEERVKVACERKFALEIDFTMAKIESACEAEGEVKACFNDKKGGVKDDTDACASDGETSCNEGFNECKSKGEEDSEDFCKQRKKMCLEQVDKKCVKQNKDALEDARKECEKDDSERQKACVSSKAKEKEEESVNKCVDEKKPTCDDDCHASCDTGKMNKCLENLGSTAELTTEFCSDFWHLLHASSEVDPETGNPIALLHARTNISSH